MFCLPRYATNVKLRQLLGALPPPPPPAPPAGATDAREAAGEKGVGAWDAGLLPPLRQEVEALVGCFEACHAMLPRPDGYPRDRAPSDDCALAASRVLMASYLDSGDDGRLVHPIAIIARPPCPPALPDSCDLPLLGRHG